MYSSKRTAHIAGTVSAAFPNVRADVLNAIVDAALLQNERLLAEGVRVDSVDEVTAASGSGVNPAPRATSEQDRNRDRQRAEQDAALEDIKAQSRGGRK